MAFGMLIHSRHMGTARKALKSEQYAGICDVRQRLTQAFLAAIHELVTLQKEQTSALIEGDLDFARFDLLIHNAAERKEAVKYELLSHLQSHGC